MPIRLYNSIIILYTYIYGHLRRTNIIDMTSFHYRRRGLYTGCPIDIRCHRDLQRICFFYFEICLLSLIHSVVIYFTAHFTFNK